MPNIFKEPLTRSFVKALTFRLLVIVSNIVIITLVTGELRVVFSVVLVSTVVNTILYIIHERVWDKVKWGRRTH